MKPDTAADFDQLVRRADREALAAALQAMVRTDYDRRFVARQLRAGAPPRPAR